MSLTVKRTFFAAGLLLGTLVSGWYLYRVHGPQPVRAVAITPDTPTTQFINVGLIYFAAIVQCRLLGRLISRFFCAPQEETGIARR
jgi:hypothetical protein